MIQTLSQMKLLYVAFHKTPEMLVAIMQRKNLFEFLKENNSYQSSAEALQKSWQPLFTIKKINIFALFIINFVYLFIIPWWLNLAKYANGLILWAVEMIA